jgi:hypothetical protein
LFENREALTQARESHLVAIDRLRRAGDRIEVIDGNAAPQVVYERIWHSVQETLNVHR